MSTIVAGEHTSIRPPQSAFTGLGALRGEIGRVRSFWSRVDRYPAGASLNPPTGRAGRTVVIVSGWACETRILHDGRRQIFSVLLPGDAAVLQPGADIGRRAVVAMTRLEAVDAEVLLEGDGPAQDAVRAAIAASLQRHEDRLLDNMVRIGRLTAKERILHLLLDLYDRLEPMGLVKEDTYRIPLTQEAFADILGLSIVHINRTLQQLRREGLITLHFGSVTLRNRARLAACACYRGGEDRIDGGERARLS